MTSSWNSHAPGGSGNYGEWHGKSGEEWDKSGGGKGRGHAPGDFFIALESQRFSAVSWDTMSRTRMGISAVVW